ncbi:hypothetical protein [Henriciella litoralis]|uniref:hypothetical protein n=1 Tax=Henriciella litoralis TaxID=568102 RepID=UPI000A025D08|nr:hypothetical protein [Henriciella litoralis]
MDQFLRLLERISKAWDRAFGLFQTIILIAAAALGAWVVWTILTDAETALLIKLGASLLGAIVAAGLAWVAWFIMKLFA